jgi:hypothetical protein
LILCQLCDAEKETAPGTRSGVGDTAVGPDIGA